ncbi:hypothetical protein BT69DRAFT_1296805 [Atractiella rhizophila]|nr:hypothetical protein BT69DRAFT_1296805 [Atractiella rhizophila]
MLSVLISAVHPQRRIEYLCCLGWDEEVDIKPPMDRLVKFWEEFYKPKNICTVTPMGIELALQRANLSLAEYDPQLIASFQNPRRADDEANRAKEFVEAPADSMWVCEKKEDVEVVNLVQIDPLQYHYNKWDACSEPVLKSFHQMCMDISAVPSTSTDVECEFSDGRQIISYLQLSMSDVTFRSQMMLRLWDEAKVLPPFKEMVQMLKEERVDRLEQNREKR